MKLPHFLNTLLLATTALLLGACSSTTSAPPAETYDGLQLQPDTRFAAVYLRPGADLTGYGSYGLAKCEVAFKKDWLRDQNNSRLNLSNRITQRDVDAAKDKLSEECDKYFREALEQAPPYQLVDSFDGGERVLVLRPAIINLDISAPDTNVSGATRTYTTHTGEMTLVLEVMDGTTGEILVRVVDRQRARDTTYLQWSSSVTNSAAVRRALAAWASQLREGLDEVTTGMRTTSE
ncbi:MAG: DUF3313 family protein [Halioglobus sp.]|nr:DUF3313 family protein [Halioglobus sp.]